jgi:hypothetical protein
MMVTYATLDHEHEATGNGKGVLFLLVVQKAYIWEAL